MEINSPPANLRPGMFFYVGWLGVVIIVMLALGGLVLGHSIIIGRQTAELEQHQQQGALALVVAVRQVSGSRKLELPGDVHGYFESPLYAKGSRLREENPRR